MGLIFHEIFPNFHSKNMGLSIVSTDILLPNNSVNLFPLFYILNMGLEFVEYQHTILYIIKIPYAIYGIFI